MQQCCCYRASCDSVRQWDRHRVPQKVFLVYEQLSFLRATAHFNSVCLSVTCVLCVKTAERIIEILSVSDRPFILIFCHQVSLRKPDGFIPKTLVYSRCILILCQSLITIHHSRLLHLQRISCQRSLSDMRTLCGHNIILHWLNSGSTLAV